MVTSVMMIIIIPVTQLASRFTFLCDRGRANYFSTVAAATADDCIMAIVLQTQTPYSIITNSVAPQSVPYYPARHNANIPRAVINGFFLSTEEFMLILFCLHKLQQ